MHCLSLSLRFARLAFHEGLSWTASPLALPARRFAQAYRSWPKYRHGWDFPGDLEGRGWNENRRVEATDPEPAYFDDESPAALEAQRATIEDELSNFIELLGKSRPHDASC